MQKEGFRRELSFLKDSTKSKTPSMVNVFLDQEGILRMDGGIANSKSYGCEVKYPILLGKHHSYTELLINGFHQQSKHLGISTTITKIKMVGFRIPQARQAVKTVLSKCTICKRYNSWAFKYPSLTDVPKHCVNFVNPHENTEIDYTGHLWVKRNGKAEKMYLSIFTCLAIKSIHIDIDKI